MALLFYNFLLLHKLNTPPPSAMSKSSSHQKRPRPPDRSNGKQASAAPEQRKRQQQDPLAPPRRLFTARRSADDQNTKKEYCRKRFDRTTQDRLRGIAFPCIFAHNMIPNRRNLPIVAQTHPQRQKLQKPRSQETPLCPRFLPIGIASRFLHGARLPCFIIGLMIADLPTPCKSQSRFAALLHILL